METFVTRSKEETKDIGKNIASRFKPGILVAFWGGLGAGKTTLIQGILETLGAEGPYSSPTFVLMKEYHLKNGAQGIERIYHVDAYRVEEKDFETLGFEEWAADPGGLILVEWPERVKGLFPEKYFSITLEPQSETERKIIVEEK